MERIAADRQSRNFVNRFPDSRDACEVSWSVLCHRAAPTVDADEERFCGNAGDFTKFAKNGGRTFIVVQVQNGGVFEASEEAAEQALVARNAIRELVVHKSAGSHASTLRAWDKE